MCLAVPMKLVSMDGPDGRAEVAGVARGVRLDLVPEARVGDYLIVHAGYAIQVMDEAAANETLELIEESLSPDIARSGFSDPDPDSR